ncbi:hypothetical protein [Streptomyces sp. SID9727]|uniref:hypothetical protein n=1 Tax=Streptomyces sp. SID9727 TaxID=2706114 RepID=UPI0013C8ACED|nr:hypothetical protein [Streptomyces sp. SID9727]NEC67370.1 hypothetical protein [Streptomyces sp. SID9727]
MDPLHGDLEQVEADLREAELEHQRLGVRIEGLRAQRDALRRIAQTPTRLEQKLQSLTKAEGIVAILRASPEPMTLGQIAEAMTAAGKLTNNNGASVYIDGLLKEGRVVRVRRGLYRDA